MCRSGHNSLLCRVGLSYRITAGNWRTRCVTHLQRLSDIQSIRGLNVVALRQVTKIVPGDPGDIKKRIAFFNGVRTATAVATFRNIPILAIVDNTSVFHLHGLLGDGLNMRRLCRRTLHRLNLRCLRSGRRRPHLRRRRNQHARTVIRRSITID